MLLGRGPVLSLIPIHVPLPLRSARVIVAIGVGVVAAAGVASYVMTRRKPTAEELERMRARALPAGEEESLLGSRE